MTASRFLPLPVALTLAFAASPGCMEDKTFAHVTVRAAEGEYEAVRQFVVYVSSNTRREILYYPTRSVTTYSFSQTETIDFSISFSESLVGTLRVGVEPRNPEGEALGYGEAVKMIDPGHVFAVDVTVVRDALPPVSPDAGARPDAPTPDAAPLCQPTAPASTCAATQTCEVACFGNTPTTRCVSAGMGKPGDACVTSADCERGSQCLQYPCGMPAARVCMKFCSTDADCGGSRCFAEIPCGAANTGFKICSVTCDPRGPATSGCAAGLSCLVFPNEVTACDCAGPRRVGMDGSGCVDAEDCAPGLICVVTDAEPAVCRPICKLADNDCAAGRTCTRLVTPAYETWGACLP